MHRLAARILRLEREVKRRAMLQHARLTRTDAIGMTLQENDQLRAYLKIKTHQGEQAALASLGEQEPTWWANWQRERSYWGGAPVSWADAVATHTPDTERPHQHSSPTPQPAERPIEAALAGAEATLTAAQIARADAEAQMAAHLRSSAPTYNDLVCDLFKDMAAYPPLTPSAQPVAAYASTS